MYMAEDLGSFKIFMIVFYVYIITIEIIVLGFKKCYVFLSLSDSNYFITLVLRYRPGTSLE